MTILNRRNLIAATPALLTGCDKLSNSPKFVDLLGKAEDGNYGFQRLLQDRTALAREYQPNQRSPIFRANGTRVPQGDAYARHVASDFADWTVAIDGLVQRPMQIALGQLRQMPSRSQITRHDCVEGWSAIAKWTGVPLKFLLDRAGILPQAKYIVFWCADLMGNGAPYYESIDRVDAAHPQTILAHLLNDQPIPVQNGAPVRMRIERQLGYKHAKYVQRIEAVADLKQIRGGKGGYWEDGAGYEWYAGI
jgi:DMSO/TMAO reductase YedYZ molybdopterin-dependent catalytic subunit